MSVWAVVVAAGRGKRSGLDCNKVFFAWRGRTVLSRCLDALETSKVFDGIVLVIHRDDRALYEETVRREHANALVRKIVFGGATRQESVYNGLRALPENAEIVAVHDAARPFVTSEIVRATVESARECGSGVISMSVVDTIKIIQPDGSVFTPERSALRAVQTPQAFRTSELLKAYQKAQSDGFSATDDAAVYEYCFGTVRLVTAAGAEKNLKLTNPEDFQKVKHAIRIGSGYDAHRLKEGRKLVLCGVEVPHERGLDGHSDADVAVHALMDALLGALAEGDIGRHFPDSDDRYKGISSLKLLESVMRIVSARGYKVGNADVTIVAQQPKLAGYIPRMRENLARALDCENVNVKATTTEHMGFEGEEIGISAQAVALLAEA